MYSPRQAWLISFGNFRGPVFQLFSCIISIAFITLLILLHYYEVYRLVALITLKQRSEVLFLRESRLISRSPRICRRTRERPTG